MCPAMSYLLRPFLFSTPTLALSRPQPMEPTFQPLGPPHPDDLFFTFNQKPKALPAPAVTEYIPPDELTTARIILTNRKLGDSFGEIVQKLRRLGHFSMNEEYVREVWERYEEGKKAVEVVGENV